MKTPIVEFQADEPQESIDLAITALVTASQLLGDALKVIVEPLTREQVQDVLDMIDNSLDALGNLGI